MRSYLRCVVVSFAAVLAVGVRAADDLKAMSGTWKVAKAEVAGQPLPPPVLKTIAMKLDGPDYEVTVDTEKGKVVDKGTVAIDGATKPKGMKITGVDGPNKGKVFLAIYEFTGDTLRVCYDLSGAKRPEEFATAPGTLLYLATYERVK